MQIPVHAEKLVVGTNWSLYRDKCEAHHTLVIDSLSWIQLTPRKSLASSNATAYVVQCWSTT